jgi:alpha-beta hydrolase superfamily lysophospholipase
VLILGHGIHEHSERFNHVFEELAGEHGLVVFSCDHRNHGRSTSEESPSGYFEDWDHVVDDWAAFIKFASTEVNGSGAPFPVGSGESLPVFLAGVSFGAMLSLHVVLRERLSLSTTPLAGVILIAPFIDVHRPLHLRIQEALGPLLSALVPRTRLVDAALPENLSVDPVAVHNYVSDPLNIKQKIAIRPAFLCGNATYWLKEHSHGFHLPLLAIHGAKDVCTSPYHTAQFVEACASKDKTFTSIEDGCHLLLHGPKQEQIVNMIANWIQSRC